MTVSASTPVLIGIGAVQQRCSEPQSALEPIALMKRAVARALEDCGVPGIGSAIQLLSVPRGMWGYTDPAALLATAAGARKCETLLADFGIMQQSLIADACRRIAAGDLEVAMVAGGEAKYRQLQAQIQNIEISETAQTDAEPDTLLKPGAELWSQIESGAGLNMPVDFYALIESAICHDSGRSMAEHRDALASRYSRFSEIAAANADAWTDQTTTAASIRDASDSNRMLAFPYTKLHNSQWNVDQASALLLCSAATARHWGVPGDKWVYPLASTESNHMVNVSQRPNLHRSAGARIAGQRALALAQLSIADVEFLELYSCFPAAVGLFERELAVPPDRDLTVTGGMTFAGGPLNNFVLQATVKLTQLLRQQPDSHGLISCVSGMFTKQGYGLWSTTPHTAGFQFEDVTAAVAAEEPARELVAPCPGSVTSIGHTTLFKGGGAYRLVAVCEYADGRRTVAFSENTALLERLSGMDGVGLQLMIDDGGQLRLPD